MQQTSRAQIIVSPVLDNSRFYRPWLEKLGIQNVAISVWDETPLPVRWLPLILFEQPPDLSLCLQEPFLWEQTNWQVLDPVHTFHNRVLTTPPFSRKADLQIFSQAGCFPCQTLIRKFQRENAEFEVLNDRSELWYQLGVRRTPSFFWQGQYFFESPQGLLLTPWARLLPSAGL